MSYPKLPDRPVSLQFEQVTFTAPEPGPALIVLGAVHGNEVAGTYAIQKWINQFRRGKKVLQKGSVTFVPICNPLAYNREQRNGDRNLNRNLTPSDLPQEFEDHLANWLCPLLHQHDVLLDLHTFAKGRQPFALFGPKNNSGDLEPFYKEGLERDLARHLGVTRFVDGWLQTYAKGVENRISYAKSTGLEPSGLTLDSRYGVGTTEWMRSGGGCALTLECGQHDDSKAPGVAYRGIESTLLYLDMIFGNPPKPAKKAEHLTLVEVIDRYHEEDQFSADWRSFDPVSEGERIGFRSTGEDVLAPFDARIVFPNPGAKPGHEWFYLAKVVS